jgi:broad specificity phosphatase PhoE
MSTRKIVLLRHAHRDTTDRFLDNGLSEKGLKQAKAIASHFREHFAKPTELLSSPKLRCQETLADYAEALSMEVEINNELIEQEATEASRDLEKRIVDYFKAWEESDKQFTVLCSHGDWIPIALYLLVDIQTDIKKAGWAELELDQDGSWKLIDIQKKPSGL